MLLAQKNPSVQWEPVPLDPAGQFIAWVWFRPVTLPTGMMFLLPPGLSADPNVVTRLTVRQLVAACGLDTGQILGWSVGGMNYDALGGTSALLDQLLPLLPSGGNLDVTVWMTPIPQTLWSGTPPTAAAYQSSSIGQAPYSTATASNEDRQLLDAIDSCWNGVAQLEVRVNSLRKELASSIARLNSLNRDLNADERRFCDSSDLQDWSEARRWLRDSVLVLSKSVKEIDTGTNSNAGKRNEFNDTYQNYVVPRIPFPGLMQAANEFDTYRKIMQNLVASAQANVARAGRDAEIRASTVLQRIAAKVRSRRRKI